MMTKRYRHLGDLRNVGKSKSLGYLPLNEVPDIDGLKKELESRGLKVIVMDERQSHVGSGAMIAYDKKSLSRLLKSRASVLEKNGWPVDPDRFVGHSMIYYAKFKTALYDVIADAYGDINNPYRSDSKSPARVATTFIRFGLLKACQSPLF